MSQEIAKGGGIGAGSLETDMRLCFGLALLLSAVAPIAGSAQTGGASHPQRPPLMPYGASISFAQAKHVAQAAEAAAIAAHIPVTIAITDTDGELLFYQQMDGLSLGVGEIAWKKARFTVRFRMPTAYVADQKAAGEDSYTRLPDAVAGGGGIPLVVQGHTIGGIGIAGATTGANEEKIAQAAQASLQ